MAKINVAVSGKGPAVVLIHGFCEDLTIWDEVVDSLKHKFKVYAVDLPGFGQSAALKQNFTLGDVAQAIHEEILKLGVPRYAVIGHSLGGYIALELTARYPESIVNFSLVHSTALPDLPEKKLGRNKAIAFINQHGASAFLGQFVPSLFLPSNRVRLTWAIDKVKNMASNVTGKILTDYMKAMRDRPERIELLKTNNNLFVYGAEDPLFTPDAIKEQIAVIKNKKDIVCLNSTAHMGMYEDFNTLIEALIVFQLR